MRVKYWVDSGAKRGYSVGSWEGGWEEATRVIASVGRLTIPWAHEKATASIVVESRWVTWLWMSIAYTKRSTNTLSHLTKPVGYHLVRRLTDEDTHTELNPRAKKLTVEASSE